MITRPSELNDRNRLVGQGEGNQACEVKYRSKISDPTQWVREARESTPKNEKYRTQGMDRFQWRGAGRRIT